MSGRVSHDNAQLWKQNTHLLHVMSFSLFEDMTTMNSVTHSLPPKKTHTTSSYQRHLYPSLYFQCIWFNQPWPLLCHPTFPPGLVFSRTLGQLDARFRSAGCFRQEVPFALSEVQAAAGGGDPPRRCRRGSANCGRGGAGGGA